MVSIGVYQIRQSFYPGEITPEEANRVSYDLAMRWTKGRHAFIVTTHTDKQHIHSHIYYNSTTLDYTRKFRNFWGSSFALRRLSDRLCLENGLSIVENPKPRSKGKFRNYGEWQAGQKKPLTYQDRLRAAIDTALAKKPADFPAFLSLMEQAGYRDYETYLPKCKEITEQLGDMIRDILNASRLQTQGNNEPCSNFSLRALLAELCEPYRLIAEAKGIKFKIELSSDAFVYLPEGRLKKAISNILSNAVNYTEAGQSISVVFDKNKLSVSNECSVLPPEQLQHIFEPFYRPDLAHSQATGGNGLGLYIVQTILDKLRLKYQFVPMPNDRGMSFTIQF